MLGRGVEGVVAEGDAATACTEVRRQLHSTGRQAARLQTRLLVGLHLLVIELVVDLGLGLARGMGQRG